jgi:hypothetical protein
LNKYYARYYTAKKSKTKENHILLMPWTIRVADLIARFSRFVRLVRFDRST